MRYSFYNTAKKFYRYCTDILSSHFKDMDITSIIAFRKFENDNFHNYTMIDDVDDSIVNLTFRKDDPSFQLDIEDHRDINVLIKDELQRGKRYLYEHIKDRYPESKVEEKLTRATDIYKSVLDYLGSYLTKEESGDLTFDSSSPMSFKGDERQLLNDINISIPLPMPQSLDDRWPHLRRDFYVTYQQSKEDVENDFFNAWRFDNAIEAFIDNRPSILKVALWKRFADRPIPCDPGKIQDALLEEAVINQTDGIKLPGLAELSKTLIEIRLIGESLPSDSLFIPIYENGFFGGLIGFKLFKIQDGEGVRKVLRKILATSTELVIELSNARESLARTKFERYLDLRNDIDLDVFIDILSRMQPIKDYVRDDKNSDVIYITYRDFCPYERSKLENRVCDKCGKLKGLNTCYKICVDIKNFEIRSGAELLSDTFFGVTPHSQISQIERILRYNEELRVRSQAEWEWLSETLAHSIKAPASTIFGGLKRVKQSNPVVNKIALQQKDIDFYIGNAQEILHFVDLISGLQSLREKNKDEFAKEMKNNVKTVSQLIQLLEELKDEVYKYSENAVDYAKFDKTDFDKRPLTINSDNVGKEETFYFHEDICKLVLKESLINMYRHSKEGQMYINIKYPEIEDDKVLLVLKNRVSMGVQTISAERFQKITGGRFARQVPRANLGIFLNHFLLNILLGDYMNFQLYTEKVDNETWQLTGINFKVRE